MRFQLICCVILFVLSNCAPSSITNKCRENLDQLIGTWAFEGTELTEHWTKVDSNHYQAVISRSFNGVLEPMQTIDIRMQGDSISYVGNRIGAADDALPIAYRLAHAEESQLSFENIYERFPQKIGYTITDANRFSVTMSGTQEGRSRSQSFNYSRLQTD